MDYKESMLLRAVETLAECECDGDCRGCPISTASYGTPESFKCIRNEAQELLKRR